MTRWLLGGGALVVIAAGAGGVVVWRRRAVVPECAQAKPLGERCGPCIAAHCCAEITACYASPDCIDLNDCMVEREELPLDAGETPERVCESRHPASIARYRAWDECATRHCEDECGRERE